MTFIKDMWGLLLFMIILLTVIALLSPVVNKHEYDRDDRIVAALEAIAEKCHE